MRYKVQGAETNERGEVDVPDNARVIGVMYHPVSLKLLVACLIELPPEQQPKVEKSKEERAEESHGD